MVENLRGRLWRSKGVKSKGNIGSGGSEYVVTTTLLGSPALFGERRFLIYDDSFFSDAVFPCSGEKDEKGGGGSTLY